MKTIWMLVLLAVSTAGCGGGDAVNPDAMTAPDAAAEQKFESSLRRPHRSLLALTGG